MNPNYGGGYDGWDHMAGSGWWGVLMAVMMVAIVALIIWAVVVVTRGHHQAPAPPPAQQIPGSDAQAILDRRLANGEVDVDEYHRLSDALREARARGSQPPDGAP